MLWVIFYDTTFWTKYTQFLRCMFMLGSILTARNELWCVELWLWMQALFWNPFYCGSVQVLCIVASQGSERCSTIHTVMIAVNSAKGCCTATTMAFTYFKQKVPKSANDQPNWAINGPKMAYEKDGFWAVFINCPNWFTYLRKPHGLPKQSS